MRVIKTDSFVKVARSPVPMPDEYRDRMMGGKEGRPMGVMRQNNDIKLDIGSKEVKRILMEQGLTTFEAVNLPKIFLFSKANLVKIGGKDYYLIHIVKSTKTKDGIIYLLDANGDVKDFPYSQIIDKITKSDDVRAETVARINEGVKAYNDKIEKIDEGPVGLSTIPLRVWRAESLLKERIGILDKQIQTIGAEARSPQNMTAYYGWIEFLRNGIRNGAFSLQDTFDTLLFLYKDTPYDLVKAIQTNGIRVPSELKEALIQIGQAEGSRKAEDKAKDQAKWEAREERNTDDLPGWKEPTDEPLQPITENDLAQGEVQKTTGYKTLEAWIRQQYAVIKNIERDKSELLSVQEKLEALREFVNELKTGQRGLDFLKSQQGERVKTQIRDFLQMSYTFLKRYEGNTVDDQGKVNRLLFGNTGTQGNAFLAIELGRLYAALRSAISV